MNFKNIVWFIKAISYFVLLRSLGSLVDLIYLTISLCCFFCQELIQNAEDAEATEVKFLYDKHSYGTKKLLSKSLAQFQVSFIQRILRKNVVGTPMVNSLFQRLV